MKQLASIALALALSPTFAETQQGIPVRVAPVADPALVAVRGDDWRQLVVPTEQSGFVTFNTASIVRSGNLTYVDTRQIRTTPLLVLQVRRQIDCAAKTFSWMSVTATNPATGSIVDPPAISTMQNKPWRPEAAGGYTEICNWNLPQPSAENKDELVRRLVVEQFEMQKRAAAISGSNLR